MRNASKNPVGKSQGGRSLGNDVDERISKWILEKYDVRV
jgi:hypothetical protein